MENFEYGNMIPSEEQVGKYYYFYNTLEYQIMHSDPMNKNIQSIGSVNSAEKADFLCRAANAFNSRTKAALSQHNEEIEKIKQRYKREWHLSDKAHNITLEQLSRTQEERNKWKDLCQKLLREMDAAEWQSPMQEETRELLNKGVNEPNWIFCKTNPANSGWYDTKDSGDERNTLWYDIGQNKWFTNSKLNSSHKYYIAYWRECHTSIG